MDCITQLTSFTFQTDLGITNITSSLAFLGEDSTIIDISSEQNKSKDYFPVVHHSEVIETGKLYPQYERAGTFLSGQYCSVNHSRLDI